MKIDLTNMRLCWWEDEQGNILELDSNRIPTKEEVIAIYKKLW